MEQPSLLRFPLFIEKLFAWDYKDVYNLRRLYKNRTTPLDKSSEVNGKHLLIVVCVE